MSPKCNIGTENGKRCDPFPFLLDIHSLPSPQHRKGAEHITQVGHTCDVVSSQMVTSSHFTFWTIIPPCPGGSKGWSRSSGSRVYGWPRVLTRSVKISTAPLNRLTAAIGSSFFHSWTLLIKSRKFKSLLSHVDTSATFTPSTTAN
jgi:hypothetical protein